MIYVDLDASKQSPLNQLAAAKVRIGQRFIPIYGDSYADVTPYWEGVYESATETVDAIFSHDDVEAETYDLRPIWAKSVALIGLRVTDTSGQAKFYSRAEATDIIGAHDIQEIEADHQAFIDHRPA